MKSPSEWQLQLVERAWRSIDQDARYVWPVKGTLLDALCLLVSDMPVATLEQTDSAGANVIIRSKLDLRTHKEPQRSAIACWIVREWGGISKRSEQSVMGWMRALGHFEQSNVERFVEQQGMNGIASWSKLLAFADQYAYAIYDSRTALALNYGLWKQGDSRRLFMPMVREYVPKKAKASLNNGQRMKLAREFLKPLHCPTTNHDYSRYLWFLKTAVELKLAPDLLRAEMFLFANAPTVAALLTDRLNEGGG